MEDKNFQQQVLERLTALETLLKQQDYKGLNEKYNDLRNTHMVDNQKVLNHETRITELEEKNKWLTRAIAGAFIVALVGLLFIFVQMGLGVK